MTCNETLGFHSVTTDCKTCPKSVYISTFNYYNSCTFGKEWVGKGRLYFIGMSVVWWFLACESLHACTSVSGAVNTQSFVWKFFMRYIYIFIRSFIQVSLARTYSLNAGL